MPDILAIGDSSIDLYMKIEGDSVIEETDGSSPKLCFYHGSKIPVNQFENVIAGNAINVTVGCKSLGVNAEIYSEIGDDQNAEMIIEELTKLGIDTKMINKNVDTLTDVHAVIIYRGERTIFSFHGERRYKILDWQKPKWIYYSSMGPGFLEFQDKFIEYVKKSGVGLAFNPGTFQMKTGVDSFKEVLKETDILFVNKEEASIICGGISTGLEKTDIKELHKKLNLIGPKLSVITDGVNGASAYDGNNFEIHKSYSDNRDVKDKTGAGDAFASGFMSAIIYGKNLHDALRWGVINSGCVIKEIGSIHGLATKKDIEEISSNLS